MLPARSLLMSACDELPLRSADVLRTGCPIWCTRRSCAGGHASAAEQQSAAHDAVELSARLLMLDGARPDGAPLVLVSLELRQLELLDKPGVELLPQEARRLAASLLRLADLAERGTDLAPAPRASRRSLTAAP